MSTPIWQGEKEFESYDKQYSKLLPRAFTATLSGALLLTLSLTVIFSASLCLVLPGVNVINNVILPGLLPGSIGLLLSLPCFLAMYLLHQKMGRVRTPWLEKYETYIHTTPINEPDEKKRIEKRADYILDELINPFWGQDYKERILIDLKNRLPEDGQRSPPEIELSKVYDKAKEFLLTPPSKRK